MKLYLFNKHKQPVRHESSRLIKKEKKVKNKRKVSFVDKNKKMNSSKKLNVWRVGDGLKKDQNDKLSPK